MGYIQTVCGNIKPEEVGITLLHEHLYADLWTTYLGRENDAGERMDNISERITLKNYGKIRRDPSSLKDNIILTDIDLIIREVGYFKEAGGSCIVDATTVGISRSPKALRKISQATGVHVVACTGFYIAETLSRETIKRSAGSLAEQMTREINEGIEETDIRAGLIGEISAPGDFEDFEKKMLEAAAITHKETGACILLHTCCPNQFQISKRKAGWKQRVMEVLDFLEEQGVDPGNIVVGHADVTVDFDVKEQIEILKRGVYLEYDNFQQEHPYDEYNTYAPTDWQRVMNIASMVKAGFVKQLIISTDLYQKAMLKEYGGWGISHIIENVIPMLEKNGLTREDIECILIENPRKILSAIRNK